jgi:hypothetical protein
MPAIPNLVPDASTSTAIPGGTVRDATLQNPAIENRLRVLLEVSHRCRAPMTLEQLVLHLPVGELWTAESVSSWVEGHPEEGHVVAGHVMPPDEMPVPEIVERTARSRMLYAEAEWAVAAPLRAAASLTRCIGVSGSVAYGYAAPNDDLDFFVTARRGTGWLFLAMAFLSYRKVQRGSHTPGPSHWCFNYVIDERDAAAEFARPGGLLLAREALTVRVLRGDPYYRSLLLRASWMSEELPQVYDRRIRDGAATAPSESRVPWSLRVANLLVYPVLATYMQLLGLARNHRLRRDAPELQFSTTTRFRRYMLRSVRFDGLDRLYRAKPPP